MTTATQTNYEATTKPFYTIPIFIGIDTRPKTNRTFQETYSTNQVPKRAEADISHKINFIPRPTEENPWANQGVELVRNEQYLRSYEVRLLETTNKYDSAKKVVRRIKEHMNSLGFNGEWYGLNEKGKITATYYVKPNAK